jgi:hypothetical protein
METTQGRPRPERPSTAGQQIVKGFDYLTLNPSPRLRRVREELGESASDPAEVVRRAWLSVGAAIMEALQTIRASSRNR